MSNATDRAVEILEKLVGFDTTSRDSNLPLIDWVIEYLAEYGVKGQHVMDGEKASLVATIPDAGGNELTGGIVLSGHTDVVPVDGQDWVTDPFQLTEKDGQLFGRGSSDMKGFIACALAAVPDLVAKPLNRPVHFAFSHDEEIGCLGVHHTIARLGDLGIKPAISIIGEPTMMRVVNAHKGTTTATTRLRGKEVHSSATPDGVNAIVYGAKFINILEDIRAELESRPDDRFTPPFTTISVGVMHGGTATNIVPKDCEIHWDCRVVPSDNARDIIEHAQARAEAELLPLMQAVDPTASITTELGADVVGLKPEEDGPAEALAKLLAQQNAVETVAYGTEAGIFQAAGSSAVVCGPGSIDVAHQPNEFVDRSQLGECMIFMARLRDHLTA